MYVPWPVLTALLAELVVTQRSDLKIMDSISIETEICVHERVCWFLATESGSYPNICIYYICISSV